MRTLQLVIMFCLPAFFAGAQSRTISGKVIDGTGNPIPFAAVKVQGTASGVSADASGNFRLPLQDTSNFIVVSSSGFTAQTLSVQGIETVIVTLVKESGMQRTRLISADPVAWIRSLTLVSEIPRPWIRQLIVFPYFCCPQTAG